MCFLSFLCGVDVVSKAEIKKQYRDVIFIEDGDGNLVKYIRAKQNEKSRGNVKATPALRGNSSKNSRRNVKPTPPPPTPPVTRGNSSKEPKHNVKVTSPPPASPPLAAVALNSYEVEAEKLNKCSVILLSLTEDDIAKERNKIKREHKINKIKENLKQLSLLEMIEFTQYAFVIEPKLQEVNGHIKLESVSDNALQLMNQYFSKDLHSNENNNNIKMSTTQRGGFAFVYCLPDLGKIIISTPMYKICTLNPLQDPMFVLGELWSINLQSDGSLEIGLPEVNGKRETFVFSEHVWRNWIGNNDIIHTQSPVESHSIQNQSAERNVPVDNSLSLIDISDIAKLLGDDEMAALFSMDWLSESLSNMSIGKSKAIDSMCEDTQLNFNGQSVNSSHGDDEDGYDASIEVGNFEMNMKRCSVC